MSWTNGGISSKRRRLATLHSPAIYSDRSAVTVVHDPCSSSTSNNRRDGSRDRENLNASPSLNSLPVREGDGESSRTSAKATTIEELGKLSGHDEPDKRLSATLTRPFLPNIWGHAHQQVHSEQEEESRQVCFGMVGILKANT